MREATEAIAAARALRTPTTQLAELVAHGIQRRVEAERQGWPFIFISEIYAGSDRISSQIEFYASVVKFMAKLAADNGRAYCVLARGDDGWSISDYAYCLGDRIEVRP
jgi:hypothetical protein